MLRLRSPSALRSGALLACLALALSAQGSGATGRAPGDEFELAVVPVLAQHCCTCHEPEDPAGELDLERFTSAWGARAEPEVWRLVREALREDEMPPASADSRPSEAQRAALLGWIEGALPELALPLAPEPGRTTLRRLNRLEYRMAVLDLVGVDYPVEQHLPADGVSQGFDVIGETLSMPPILFEKYVDAAEDIAREALPTSPAEEVPAQRFSLRDLHPAENHEYAESSGRFAMYSNGKSTVAATANSSGEYLVRVEASARQAGPRPAGLVLSANERRLERFEVEAAYAEPAVYEARAQLEAGELELGLAFVNDFYDPDESDPERRDLNLYLSSLELIGPIDRRQATPFQLRYGSPGDGRGARRILARLAPLFWRGPVTERELDDLLSLAEPGADERARLRQALVTLLVSPRFLFRVEPEPEGAARALDGHELATRLAAFLWSSVPDEELLALARAGALSDGEELHAQLERMLRDARASRLARGFAAGWLQLERLQLATPDPDRFPDFEPELRDSMRRESELFFEAMLREGRPVSEFLEADFTFVDERLADHYGLAGVQGSSMRRVPIPEHLRGRRGGLLGQAALLTATSHAARTSPVLRGKWVLEALLATPPSPPPANAGALDESRAATAGASIRERLERHRRDPACAACHAPMDGLGFALEHYDATGAWRERDGDFEIDARGDFPGEASIHGAAGLRERLLAGGAFRRGLARHLYTYALGRALAPADEAQLDELLQGLPPDPTLNELLHALCDTPAFRTRQAEAGPTR